MDAKSGRHWVAWANVHARNSRRVEDLDSTFRRKIEAFTDALADGGARVGISATRRSPGRAYLFHWSWKIAHGRCKASEAEPMAGIPIQWDHGDDRLSRSGALEMVQEFGLAVPPRSIYPPALSSNHIAGRAIDMDIRWSGTIRIAKKEGAVAAVAYMPNVNSNLDLHAVGASYGVLKLRSDAPHWSFNGR